MIVSMLQGLNQIIHVEQLEQCLTVIAQYKLLSLLLFPSTSEGISSDFIFPLKYTQQILS